MARTLFKNPNRSVLRDKLYIILHLNCGTSFISSTYYIFTHQQLAGFSELGSSLKVGVGSIRLLYCTICRFSTACNMESVSHVVC